MTDRKLTDVEIIDGFNHCLNTPNCDGCGFKGEICNGSLDGKIITLRMVAEVLNRQKAENDWLKNELIDRNNAFLKVKTQLLNAEAEIERLREFEYMYNDLCK